MESGEWIGTKSAEQLGQSARKANAGGKAESARADMETGENAAEFSRSTCNKAKDKVNISSKNITVVADNLQYPSFVALASNLNWMLSIGCS